MKTLVPGTYVEMQGYHIPYGFVALVVDENPHTRVWISDHQEGGSWGRGEYRFGVVSELIDAPVDYRYMAFEDIDDHFVRTYDNVKDALARQKYIEDVACALYL
jgi:uncharacterized protein (DUF1786 family)